MSDTSNPFWGLFSVFWSHNHDRSFTLYLSVRLADYLSWNVRDDTGVSFISNDLRYVNGTITIPSDGRYHVYTHLTFDTNNNRLESQQLVVDHSITRISRGTPVYLLLDRVNLHRREVKSSDLEGTFELRKGDQVKVIVSYPSYLYNLPQTNVFGLFKLVSG